MRQPPGWAVAPWSPGFQARQDRSAGEGGCCNAAEYPVLLGDAGRFPVASQARDRGRVLAPPTYLPVGSILAKGPEADEVLGEIRALGGEAAHLQVDLARRCRPTASGRLGEVEDIIGPMLFLASRMSDHVHGQTLSVDGGFTGV